MAMPGVWCPFMREMLLAVPSASLETQHWDKLRTPLRRDDRATDLAKARSDKTSSNSRLEMTSRSSASSAGVLKPPGLLKATSFSDVGGLHCGKRKCKECMPTVSLRSLFSSSKKLDTAADQSFASAHDFASQLERHNAPRSKSFSHSCDARAAPSTLLVNPHYGATLSPGDAPVRPRSARTRGRNEHGDETCCDISIRVPQIQLHNDSGSYVIGVERK